MGSVPDNFDFSLQDVVDVVQPSSGDALIGCFVDAGATIFDPTHVPGFDSRYEGYHERLTNFRNYPTDPETLYNWYAATHQGSTVKYGYLYNWYAATDAKNIANTGWNVPTRAEFNTLIATFGGDAVAGGHLKESGTSHWLTPNTDADNSSGFTGLGNGVRDVDGLYQLLNEFGSFHSSDDYAVVMNVGFLLAFDTGQAGSWSGVTTKKEGFSIRLMRTTALPNETVGTYTGNDGRVYDTIVIGTQEWLSENLAETKYRNGDPITKVTGGAAWMALITEGYCAYDNDESNAFDLVYDLAPTGWHVNTLAEFQSLSTFLGGDSVAGGKLKEAGLAHWANPNAGATNSSGFTAIPGGMRFGSDGSFAENIISAYFHSSDDYAIVPTNGAFLDFGTDDMGYIGSTEKEMGRSIRCIMNGVDPVNPGSVTDIDGNIYPTVKIGTQVWMALNLKVIHYNDGTLIPELSDDNDWINDTDGARCYYV